MPADPCISDKRLSLDDRINAVQVNPVNDGGSCWINVISVNWFSLQSSAWWNRLHQRKQGLKRQAEKLLPAAEPNQVAGQTPRVIFSFAKGVRPEVGEAFVAMGAEVEGVMVEPS